MRKREWESLLKKSRKHARQCSDMVKEIYQDLQRQGISPAEYAKLLGELEEWRRLVMHCNTQTEKLQHIVDTYQRGKHNQ